MTLYPLLNECWPELRQRGYQLDKLLAAYDDLSTILGSDWLQRELKRRRGHLFHSHPLLNVFSTASVSSILLALEIYMGLKVFVSDPGLETLLRDLRLENAFEGAFFSLATALRFHLLGFSVQLEAPALENRKSDLLATKSDQRYMVECTSRPTLQAIKTNHTLYLQLLHKSGVADNLLIDLDVHSDKGMEQEATSIFKKVLKECANNPGPVRIEGQTLNAAARTLSSEEVGHPSFPQNLAVGWDWSNVFDGTMDAEESGQILWRVVVRIRQSEPQPLEKIIDGQIERKHDQLRRHLEDACSVLFIQTHQDPDNLDQQRFLGRLKSHLQSLPSLAAVILSIHKWTDRKCYVHDRRFYLHEHAPRPFPTALAGQLDALESDFEGAHLIPFINGQPNSALLTS